jgi:phosphate acetyltransferase
MTTSIYLVTTDPHCGRALISLGLTDLLLRKTKRVGVFCPVIGSHAAGTRDRNIDLLLTHFNLGLRYKDTFAFLRQEAADLLSRGRYDDLLTGIIEEYKALESQCDFVLCIGADLPQSGAVLEFDYNADIAKNLGSSVLILSSAAHRDVAPVVSTVRAALSTFAERGTPVLGVVVNRADPSKVAELTTALRAELPHESVVLAVIPTNDTLQSPTLREIAGQLGAETLYGADQLDKLARGYLVIAMQLQNYLPRLTEGALLITPGDRDDVVVSALQAHNSRYYPSISGIVLTGGFRPAPSVARLLDGLPSIVPILSVKADTFTTATQMGTVRSHITADNHAKIALSLELFEEHVDTEALRAQLSSVQVRGVTPRMFIYGLVQKAKVDRRHIVLAEGNDERILRAAALLHNRDIVDLTLLGNPREVRDTMQRLGLQVDLEAVPVIEPQHAQKLREYAETLADLRKHKGMNLETALDLMCDVSYFGTMMVYKGDADGMVSGATHTTLHTIRPALQFIKTKPGFSVVSSVFFMCLDDRVLVYGDCAVNPNPTAEELAEIALSSADTAQAFGIEPKVAMLSYSSGESGVGEDVDRVRTATQLAQALRPGLKLVGPIQYDAAVDMGVAAQKMPGSEVAGQATVFIFPDLNTGNNTYKAVQRETGAIAIGPVLQGLKKPVNDLSRGCTVEDIVNTVVITAIQAQTL